MTVRMEHDAMGEVAVPADRLWGAQTQRSREHFRIGVGRETMPQEIIAAFGLLKLAAARANRALLPEKMTEEKLSGLLSGRDLSWNTKDFVKLLLTEEKEKSFESQCHR